MCSRTSSEQQSSSSGREEEEEVTDLSTQRRHSEPSSYDQSYLLWDSVLYVGTELKRGVDRGLQWISYPLSSFTSRSWNVPIFHSSLKRLPLLEVFIRSRWKLLSGGSVSVAQINSGRVKWMEIRYILFASRPLCEALLQLLTIHLPQGRVE